MPASWSKGHQFRAIVLLSDQMNYIKRYPLYVKQFQYIFQRNINILPEELVNHWKKENKLKFEDRH